MAVPRRNILGDNFFLLLGIGCLLCIAFLIYYQTGKLLSKREEVKAAQAAVERAELRVKQAVRLKDQSAGLQEQMAQLERTLPTRPDEDVLINDFKSAAGRSGLQLQQVRFDARVTRQGFVEMPVKFTCEGRYYGLLGFLADLRDGPRAVSVKELKIGKAQKGTPDIKVDITASAFYAAGR